MAKGYWKVSKRKNICVLVTFTIIWVFDSPFIIHFAYTCGRRITERFLCGLTLCAYFTTKIILRFIKFRRWFLDGPSRQQQQEAQHTAPSSSSSSLSSLAPLLRRSRRMFEMKKELSSEAHKDDDGWIDGCLFCCFAS